MQEIEVKARVKNKKALLEKLTSLGCILSDPLTQHDRIFIEKSLSKVPVNNGDNVLRIREQNGKFIFTLKQQVSNQMDCIEKESEISNPDAMYDAFELLGFHEIARVSKTRRKCAYNHEVLGKIEICLDDVENLGTYIEVESFATDAEKTQAELFKFLETLGVKKEDQEFNGYDVIMFEKNQSLTIKH